MKRIIFPASLLLLFLLCIYALFIRSPLTINEVSGKQKTLIVLLHGYTLDSHSLTAVRNTMLDMESFREADVINPELPLNYFSMASINEVAAALLIAIDNAWEKSAADGEPYQNIVFVGHSVGGLLARKIYVAAHGETAEAPFEHEFTDYLNSHNGQSLATQRPWANKVSRIVLLAGMNRGWSISHHMSLTRAAGMKLAVPIGHLLELIYQRPPLIMELRKGSPFITQLRLQWLAMEKARFGETCKADELNTNNCPTTASTGTPAEAEKPDPFVVVQLLGNVDDLVSPDDNLDLVVGHNFLYLPVPHSGHGTVIELNDETHGNQRKTVFKNALTLTDADPNHLDFKEDKINIRPDVRNVVFVVHGIRDKGYWTSKIAQHIKLRFRANGDKGVVAAQTSTYGYFPMLSFLRPGERQEKVEWFMDEYVRARALYPNADFHFVGHSHGTYLVAKALTDYPAVSFKRVVFAGSVVRKQYAWEKLTGTRVEQVLNYVATSDWVVAFFPKALQTLNMQDLGSAGHDGFEDASVVQPKNFFVRGGHSAALNEDIWDSIATFVVTGNFINPPKESFSNRQSAWVSYPAYIAPLIWVLIIGLLVWGFRFLYKLPIREWKKTLAIVGYLLVIWTILTEL